MKKPSEYVKIPRRRAEELLKLAAQIGNMDQTEREGLTSGERYAHALGRCNSLGREIEAALASHLEYGR